MAVVILCWSFFAKDVVSITGILGETRMQWVRSLLAFLDCDCGNS